VRGEDEILSVSTRCCARDTNAQVQDASMTRYLQDAWKGKAADAETGSPKLVCWPGLQTCLAGRANSCLCSPAC
jgi:hypothetical protein